MNENETSRVHTSEIIHPLSAADTADFLNFYKNFFVSKLKNELNLSKTEADEINAVSYVHNKLDPNCMRKIDKRLVRVQYPADVQHPDRALQTLGGLSSLEISVAERKKQLHLCFHPDSRFAKPCTADKNFKPGILVRVKVAESGNFEPKPGCSREPDGDAPSFQYDYDVVGATVINYSFNRLCDFQYLPLVADHPEDKQSKCDYIYNRILPDKLPDIKWLLSDESKQMPLFLLPSQFSHFDSPSMKLNLTDGELDKFAATNAKGDFDGNKLTEQAAKQRRYSKIGVKTRPRISIFANCKDKNMPDRPLDLALKLVQTNAFKGQFERVKQLFEQRPIWMKSAVMHNVQLTLDQSKVVLPAVAYFFYNGPWRMSWVKYGYDPRKDPKARIYQTLDYRIRAAENSTLKVVAKRSYTANSGSYFHPFVVKKVSLNDDISIRPKARLDETYYMLRPSTLPPARQMFYHFCDVMLPEVQDLISQLSINDDGFDIKHGWFPKDFNEQCREIVNGYVLKAVQKEILEENKVSEEQAATANSNEEKSSAMSPSSTATAPDYCTEMLSNIKKGIYKEVNIMNVEGTGEHSRTAVSGRVDDGDVELISLSSDDEDVLQVENLIQNTMPEKIVDDDDDEDGLSDDYDNLSESGEIDAEAIEEINQMMAEMNKKL